MKGFMYTIEVLVAIGIIAVASVMIFKNVPEKTQTDITTLKIQGIYAMRYIDDTGLLRELVNTNNESGIEGELKALLPSTAGFEAEICTSPCPDTNVPNAKDVVSVDYFISGYRREYLEKRVKLWIWKK